MQVKIYGSAVHCNYCVTKEWRQMMIQETLKLKMSMQRCTVTEMRYESSHVCLYKCRRILNFSQRTLNSSLLLLLYYFIAIVHTLIPKSSHVLFLRSKDTPKQITLQQHPTCMPNQLIQAGFGPRPPWFSLPL